MRQRTILQGNKVWHWLALAAVLAAAPTVRAADLKLEAQLIWGANEAKSPNPKHKPADPVTERKLKSLPFKWTHYFEVNRQQLTVPQGEERRVTMSKECEIAVKNLGDSTVEMVVYGKGEQVGRITQALPRGHLLVTGGNAPNFTGWFVVLKRSD